MKCRDIYQSLCDEGANISQQKCIYGINNCLGMLCTLFGFKYVLTSGDTVSNRATTIDDNVAVFDEYISAITSFVKYYAYKNETDYELFESQARSAYLVVWRLLCAGKKVKMSV